jgi:hypothetical protein
MVSNISSVGGEKCRAQRGTAAEGGTFSICQSDITFVNETYWKSNAAAATKSTQPSAIERFCGITDMTWMMAEE